MLSELELTLHSSKPLNYRQSSLLQGVLFEQISSDFADEMHEMKMHPYSQYLTIDNRSEDQISVWHINTLNEIAYREITERLLSASFSGFQIKKDSISVTIEKKEVRTLKETELMNAFYDGQSPKSIQIRFLTPTAFKKNGLYQTLPEPRLIFQNLMSKYSVISGQTDMIDEDALEELAAKTFLSRFRIRSVVFPLENTKISGCTGDVTLGFRGSDTMKRYANVLLRFATFAGIGIKTGMGMGAVEITEAYQ